MIFSMILLLFAPVAFGENALYRKDLSLPKDARVKIEEYDKKHQMLKVSSVKFPGEDDSWLKMTDFLNSIELNKANAVRITHEIKSASPKHLGKKFLLTKPITTYAK